MNKKPANKHNNKTKNVIISVFFSSHVIKPDGIYLLQTPQIMQSHSAIHKKATRVSESKRKIGMFLVFMSSHLHNTSIICIHRLNEFFGVNQFELTKWSEMKTFCHIFEVFLTPIKRKIQHHIRRTG